MSEFSTVYSKNTYSAIKKYLKSNTYPEKNYFVRMKKIQKKNLEI